MSPANRRMISWAPRALGIRYALFISIFALDVFEAGIPLTRVLLALAIHLIPAGIVVVVLAFARKWEWLGSVGFIALGRAHRQLPLGTSIRVTDLLNLRSVVLKVNDRGPYVDGRVLDVSRATGKCLEFLVAALAPVRIEAVSCPRHCITMRWGLTIAASASRPADR